MKNSPCILIVIIFGTLFGTIFNSEKNNHLTFSITNKTNLNFYVHTCDLDEPAPSNGSLLSGKTYQYQRSFSRQELLQYKSLDFNGDLRPWKKWFAVSHHETGQNFIVDILLAYFNLHQRLEIDLSGLKVKNHYIRHDPHTDPFKILIHLTLAKHFEDDFFTPDSNTGFRKMNLQGSKLEITEVNEL